VNQRNFVALRLPNGEFVVFWEDKWQVDTPFSTMYSGNTVWHKYAREAFVLGRESKCGFY
jgi:hypothetical protein